MTSRRLRSLSAGRPGVSAQAQDRVQIAPAPHPSTAAAPATLSLVATPKRTRKLLTTREVADELRVSLTTVYRLISAGGLRAVQIAGPASSLRIRREDLDRFEAPSSWTTQERSAPWHP